MLELWLSARSLKDWIETPAKDRAALARIGPEKSSSAERRAEALSSAPELTNPIQTFSVLFRQPTTRVDERRIAELCSQVAAWLEKRGHIDLALRFAEISATFDQDSPRRANHAGRIARIAGIFWRSDIWYGRGVGLANETGDNEAKVRAYLGWGTLHADTGRMQRARKLFGRAAWGARRSGERWLSAMVNHDLLVMAATIGAFREAEVFGRRAFRAYPTHNIRLPPLAYDLARFFIRMHCYGPALKLLQAAAEKYPTPQLNALGWGGLAWAAGGVRDASAYQAARDRVLNFTAVNELGAASALINVAYGARAIGDWTDAHDFAERVLHIVRATPSGLEEEADLAKSLIVEVGRRVEAPAPADLPSPTKPTEEPLSQLVGRFLRKLSVWRGPTWRRKHQAGPEDRPHA